MATNKEQMEIAGRLQGKLLERFEKLIDSNELSATDAATLVRLLSQNGWVLDESRIPSGLKGKLTQGLSPSDFENDGTVIPIQNARKA